MGPRTGERRANIELTAEDRESNEGCEQVAREMGFGVWAVDETAVSAGS